MLRVHRKSPPGQPDDSLNACAPDFVRLVLHLDMTQYDQTIVIERRNQLLGSYVLQTIRAS